MATLLDATGDCSVTLTPPTATDGCGQTVTGELGESALFSPPRFFSALYRNISGSLIAGNNTVTITLNNNLTNAQVVTVLQNISALYFDVTGYSGVATLKFEQRRTKHIY